MLRNRLPTRDERTVRRDDDYYKESTQWAHG
jgi:hypothetical protein